FYYLRLIDLLTDEAFGGQRVTGSENKDFPPAFGFTLVLRVIGIEEVTLELPQVYCALAEPPVVGAAGVVRPYWSVSLSSQGAPYHRSSTIGSVSRG
ncbi:MAG: hypothetical protein H0U91_05815, partial [Rubrobacter sp.]|nr:hypothetical protein [Rubrobacter sp.]